MSKRVIKLIEKDYEWLRASLIPYIDSYDNIKELTIVMNTNTKDKLEYYLKAPIFDKLFGAKIKLSSINDNTVIFDYNDSNNLFDNNKSVTLPERYIVNKDAAILFYGNNKTIVKRSKGDKIDSVKAFLWAYFLRNTGMSRTKANKYLFNVWKLAQEEIHKK